ncbi:MAG: hypothetical protein ACOCTT_01950 [archaeon]
MVKDRTHKCKGGDYTMKSKNDLRAPRISKSKKSGMISTGLIAISILFSSVFVGGLALREYSHQHTAPVMVESLTPGPTLDEVTLTSATRGITRKWGEPEDPASEIYTTGNTGLSEVHFGVDTTEIETELEDAYKNLDLTISLYEQDGDNELIEEHNLTLVDGEAQGEVEQAFTDAYYSNENVGMNIVYSINADTSAVTHEDVEIDIPIEVWAVE